MTALTSDELLVELEQRGAILNGHFRLSSGRHSNCFVQKFRILEDPKLVEAVSASMVEQLDPESIDVVVSAAIGGIVLGYECARQLDTLGIFVEKEDGKPKLRRGFALEEGDRALVVEDVVTTGLSVREVMDVVRGHGAEVTAVGAIVRRAEIDFGVPTVVLLDLPIESYAPEECPQCRIGEAITEPGSRFLR
jgi:orotate phosphoribosyltransferase